MISSQGSQSTDFDVLNSQRTSDSDVVHVIKINKKIQDTGFTKVIKPTELTPAPQPDLNSSGKSKSIPEEKFVVPKELTDYLDFLIVKKKLPLRTLRFDVEFSRSKEEVAKHLEDHSEKIGNIEAKDLDKMFSFIGYGKEISIPEDVVVKNENTQPILQDAVSAADEVKAVTQKVAEVSNVSLEILRANYANLYISHIQKLKSDIKVYKMMMSQLGANKVMPTRPEPTELIIARKEYHDARKKAGFDLDKSIEESFSLISSEVVAFPMRAQERLKKAFSYFDNYVNDAQVSESLMNADSGSIALIVDPNTYGGMRAEKIIQQVSPKEETQIISETTPKPIGGIINYAKESVLVKEIQKKEEIEQIKPKPELVPEKKIEKIHHKEIKQSKLVDLAPEKPEVIPVPEIKVEIIQSFENFIPKTEEKSLEIPKNKFAVRKVEEKLPVDSAIAQTPLVAQNVYPTEFEDKKLEVQHGFPGKPNDLKVFYDGKEIAKGIVGGKVAINKEYKSGFLLADTQEERALSHAHKIIKTLRAV